MNTSELFNRTVIAMTTVEWIDVGTAVAVEILKESILQETVDSDDRIFGQFEAYMPVENIVSRNNDLNPVRVGFDPGFPIFLGSVRGDLVSQADHHDGPDQGIMARHDGMSIDGMDVLTDMGFCRDGNSKGSHIRKINSKSIDCQLFCPQFLH